MRQQISSRPIAQVGNQRPGIARGAGTVSHRPSHSHTRPSILGPKAPGRLEERHPSTHPRFCGHPEIIGCLVERWGKGVACREERESKAEQFCTTEGGGTGGRPALMNRHIGGAFATIWGRSDVEAWAATKVWVHGHDLCCLRRSSRHQWSGLLPETMLVSKSYTDIGDQMSEWPVLPPEAIVTS